MSREDEKRIINKHPTSYQIKRDPAKQEHERWHEGERSSDEGGANGNGPIFDIHRSSAMLYHHVMAGYGYGRREERGLSIF